MTNDQFQQLMRSGKGAMDQGDTLVALIKFSEAAKIAQPPQLQSSLAYCLAKERRKFATALGMCQEAIQGEPHKSQHYLLLGRIYLLAGHKRPAIKAFRQGLKMERNQHIINELRNLGIRQDPPIRSLPRNHALNRFLGIWMARLHMR